MRRNPVMFMAAWLLAAAAPGTAQVGGGYWKPYYPTGTVQERGSGAHYTKADGIESFTISGNDERCEMRVGDDYNSGVRQFEGWVRIRAGSGGTSGNAGPSAGACIAQVFKFMMIVVYNLHGGELHQHSQMDLRTYNAYGRWIRVNTIHDADNRKAEVWIDGELKLSFAAGTGKGPNGFYHKYGVYNGSGSNPLIEWRDTRYWEGSKEPYQGSSVMGPAVKAGPRVALFGNPGGDRGTLNGWDLAGRRVRITGVAGGDGLYVTPAVPEGAAP